jgi:preprotein translocase subunit SecF
VVEDLAMDICLVIESDIEKAIERREDCSITEVSTSFEIPPMKREDAQRAVYYKILKELKTAGYRPSIQFKGTGSNQQVFIHVKWKTQLDETQQQAMDNFIKQHAQIDPTGPVKAPGSRRRRP